MKNGSGRLIVGFFPSQLLPGVRDRVGRSRRHVTAIEDRFAALCLPGETAVAALAAAGSVERVVENMRGYSGPGAVFVIGEEILRESGAAPASREPALAAESAAAREKRVREDALLAILAALAWFPLSELAVQIVNALVITLLPPRKLPKLDLRGGIGPENAGCRADAAHGSGGRSARAGEAGGSIPAKPRHEFVLRPVFGLHRRANARHSRR